MSEKGNRIASYAVLFVHLVMDTDRKHPEKVVFIDLLEDDEKQAWIALRDTVLSETSE